MKEKNKKKFNCKIIIGIILVIIIIISIISVVIIKKQNINNQENNEIIENRQYNSGLIDMNNTENVKIENSLKENISENVLKDRTLEGLEINYIKLYAQDETSYFSALVKNNTGTDFTGKVAKISFINKDGNIYDDLEIYIPSIKNEDMTQINSATTADITNAYDISIEFEK